MRRLSVLLALVMAVAACGDTSPQSSAAAPASNDTTVPAATDTTAGDPTSPPIEPVALTPSPGVERSEPEPDAPVDQLVGGFAEAGFDLMRTQESGENLVFSPLSIGHALLMARGAADEPTGQSIDTAFGLPDGMSAHEAWNALDLSMDSSAETEGEVTLSIADRIWPHLEVEPDQEWIDTLAAQHGASVEALDLKGDPDGSRDVINQWVADNTEDLIPELLPGGFINSRTDLILTDAIYFAAQWQKPFGKYPSEAAEFTALDGSTQEVQLMHELEMRESRGTGDGYAGAEVPYIGGDYSMLLIVPDEGRFEEIRDRLGQDLLDEIASSFTVGEYELFMPQWEHETDLDFLAWLEELGIAPGSFPGIAPGTFLAGAVHGADIAVDEEGTVAAAATALGFEESAAPQPEFVLRADRPFFYLIRHRPTGAVLFAGQVTSP